MTRIGLRAGNEEGTCHKLLAATHCVRPNNGWNQATTSHPYWLTDKCSRTTVWQTINIYKETDTNVETSRPLLVCNFSMWSAVAQLVECRTRNRESPGSNPRCYRFEVWAFSFTSRRLSRLSCINEYLAIDSGGNVSE